MVNHTPIHTRRAVRIKPQMIGISFVFIVVLIVVVWFRWILQVAPYRQTIVIAGSPTHIFSLNADRTHLILIDIPEDTVVSAMKGYGKYSVRSLITLDDLDKHRGTLIALSLSDALGIPISWYMAPGAGGNGSGSVDMVRRIFSLGSIVRALTGKLETSVPLLTWIRLVFWLRFIPADAVEVLDVQTALVSIEAPDGSILSTLDENKLDFVLRNSLYDAGLREENLTVAVYNTTQIRSVGQRASRQLSRLGIQLVFVGNTEIALSECEITGSDSTMRSKTAQFIRSYFHCKTRPKQGDTGKETGADIIVTLGTDYASQYE